MSSFNAPAPAAAKPNFFDMMNTAQPARASSAPFAAKSPMASPPIAPASSQNFSSFAPLAPNSQVQSAKPAPAAAFDDLFALAGAPASSSAKPAQTTMADLAQRKASNSLWSSAPAAKPAGSSGGFDDLLF
jgi:hypothetical protein